MFGLTTTHRLRAVQAELAAAEHRETAAYAAHMRDLARLDRTRTAARRRLNRALRAAARYRAEAAERATIARGLARHLLTEPEAQR